MSLMDLDNNEVQILGEPQVHLIGTSQDNDASNERAKWLLADKESAVLIVKGKVNTDESEGTVFYSNMASSILHGNASPPRTSSLGSTSLAGYAILPSIHANARSFYAKNIFS